MMTKIIFHIGRPKAGTTAIQHFMSDNYAVLKENGILYPKSGETSKAHYCLAPVWMGEIDWAFLKNHYDSLLIEIAETNCHTVLISSESFTFPSPSCELVHLLGDIFDGFKVEVFFYVREQCKIIQSNFLQWQKMGHAYGPSINDYLEKRGRHSFDFEKNIAPWETVFGQSFVKASLYHPEIIGGDVRHHFLDRIGLSDRDLFAKLNFESGVHNLSIHPLFSKLVSKIDHGGVLNNRQQIIDEMLIMSSKMKEIKYSLFTPGEEMEIKRYYLESNVSFADKYLSQREKALLIA